MIWWCLIEIQRCLTYKCCGNLNQWVHNMLHQHFNLNKLSARCVPRLLTVVQKRNRVTYSKDSLLLFPENPQNFSSSLQHCGCNIDTLLYLRSIHTIGCQRRVWTKNCKDRLLAWKVTATVLGNSKSNLLWLFGKLLQG